MSNSVEFPLAQSGVHKGVPFQIVASPEESTNILNVKTALGWEVLDCSCKLSSLTNKEEIENCILRSTLEVKFKIDQKLNSLEPSIYPEPGEKYQHYKGGRYKVLFLTKHTETNEVLVIYESISFKTTHARPLSMWFQKVEEGEPRFKLITKEN